MLLSSPGALVPEAGSSRVHPPCEAVASLAARCPGGTLARAPLEVVGLRMHMSGGASSPWGVSWAWGRGAWRRCSETGCCGALFGVFLFLCGLFCSHRQLWLSRPPLRPFHVEVKPLRLLFLKCRPIVVFSLAGAKRAPAQDPPPPGNLPRALRTSPAGFLPLRKVPRTEVPVIVG